MDCCLVPYLPAVTAAVEHLEELDKQLQEEAAPFAPEASIHLAEIAAALAQLEADRRAAREHLEAESIENSTLRDRLHNTRERMSREMTAAVAAVRESNAGEMERLRRDLSAACQLREETAGGLQAGLSQNKTLYAERDQARAEREEIIATLNDQILLKSSLEMQMDQTLGLTEELKSSTAATKLEMGTLEDRMTLERAACHEQEDGLSREVDRAEERIKEQMEADRTSQQELDRVKEKKGETLSRLRDIKNHIAELESTVQGLGASRCHCEQQLEEEIQKHQELKQQIETQKELDELGEHLTPAIPSLQDQIATIDDKIKEGCASRLLFQDTLPQMCERFRCLQDEETELKAERSRLTEQLELRLALQQELPLLVEDRMASMVKHRKEMRDMEEKMKELQEEDVINRRVFKRSKEELLRDMDTEKENLGPAEEELEQVSQLLEDAERKQDEHEAKMRSDISNAKRRYKEALQRKAALQQQMPECTDADMLMSHVAQSEMEYKKKESILQQKTQKCITETESISKSTREKQKKLDEKEEMLKEVEDKWIETQSRTGTLRALTSEQSERMTDLQLSNQAVRDKTSSLLFPKEDMKAELEELRESYIGTLDKQASELRAVEVSIYENDVYLEQVGMENSRLHFSIRQMTEDIRTIRHQTDQSEQEIQQFNHKIKALNERIQEAFRANR